MTDEQIIQNAEQHVIELFLHGDRRYYEKNGFVAGAHSRDEEIKQLELEKKHYQDIAWFLAAENEQLRNPWISVEDRLPDIGQKVITITNKGKLLLVARTTQPPHKEEGGWRWEHYIGKVTHWMPIPKLKEERV